MWTLYKTENNILMNHIAILLGEIFGLVSDWGARTCTLL